MKDETSVGFPFGMESEPMPPLGVSTAPVSDSARRLDRSVSHNKSMFASGNKKLAISHPILQENAGQNPLSKIAVMDLKEAAMADRERRARMYDDENAAASRRAGPLMGMTPEEVLTRGVSLKRKEIASVSRRESVFPGALHPEDVAVALTTSAQLSPGGDETRRRSPRPSVQEESVQPRQASPVQSLEPVKSQSPTPPNRPLTVQQPLPRNNIRPSRMLPPSPKTPPPEPTKTPLQRRPTIGLPSNPRARGLKVAEEPGSQHRTILFVNNIEYNDPLAVEAIIKTAGHPATKMAPPAETPRTSLSVVNRPRPIPRKPADSPAQASPALSHRRSKSGGSLMGRKSLLAASPGSPTRLPPLPSLPKSAVVPARAQPNDTKSMTFEEKLTLMFPNPPSARAIKRRSSVPDVPLVPVSYLDMDSSPSEPFDRHRSNRTTKTSVRTESILEVDEIPRLPGKAVVNTADEAGSSWLRAFRGEDSSNREDRKRSSSPTMAAVPVRASAWTETTYDRSEDDATNWSPMNSPQIAVGVPVMQKLGLPASVKMPSRQDMRGSQLSFADNRSRETLPIMLDTANAQQAGLEKPLVKETEVVATPELPTWHRRVGDECPTFSARKERAGSRKTPAPAPLALHTTSTKKMLAIQVEPSPLESPGQAIRQIQSQLKKLEETEQTPQSASRRIALLEDLEREMGQQVEHWNEIKHDMGRDSMSSMQTTSPTGQNSRHASVASTINVTREPIRQSIGAERRASRLARMRNNGNPSIPEASVRNSGSPQLSKWQKRLTEAQMDYMDAQLLRGSNVNFLQLSRAQLASPTPPDSDHSSEAELSPIPIPSMDIAAEQPPQTHSKPTLLWRDTSKVSTVATGLLWMPVSKPAIEPEAPLPGLSVRPAQRKELAPLKIESRQLWRKPYNTATRSVSGLWRPIWASAAPPAQPLVRTNSKSGTTSQKAPRPVTQRPPRRNKRVTLLPDILENPEPLPDKRGTLGIFQFPWGEKSDTASIQPRPSMYMAMPGTMTSGGPSLGAATGVRSKQPEQTEYSSSFFDDYDDEDQDGEMDSDEEDSDDAFDETTLWEIASLLKTDAVPSKNSLLPPASGSVVEDYMYELDSDEEGQSSREESIVIGLAEPRELLIAQQRDSATIEGSTLLMLEDALESKTPPKPVARIGLPSNPKPSRDRQVSLAARPAASEEIAAPEMSRTARHTAEAQRVETAPRQGSAGLWYPPSQADKPSSREGLFVPGSNRPGYRGTLEEPAAKYITRKPRPAEEKPLDGLTSTKLWVFDGATRNERIWILGSSSLWSAPNRAGNSSPRGGLFVPRLNQPSYRGTSAEPAAKYISRKPRPTEQKPLDELASTKLWALEDVVRKTDRNWIVASALWYPSTQKDKPSSTGLFVPGFNRSNYRGTSAEPAAKYIVRTPRAIEQKPLDDLTSTNLWIPKHGATKSERNWIHGTKTQQQASRIPVRRRQRPQASREDWAAALNEAIRAGSKKPKRIAATPAQWRAALEEAITLSARAPAFNPAARHPVFAAQSLVTRSVMFHPAATGYTSEVKEKEPRQDAPRRDNTAIQAQIEALEQERLFVERAAREEYRRRTSMASAAAAVTFSEPAVEEATMAMMPAGAETVQDLQRRLSMRIRQSLVFASPVPVVPKQPGSGAVARSASSESKNTRETPVATSAHSSRKDNHQLWTPAPSPSAPAPGLWSSMSTTTTTKHSPSSLEATAEEDGLAVSQRARRRRVVQRKRRRQEILSQIAAVERGANPFVDFAGMRLWSVGGKNAPQRDWLHSLCVRRTRGVVLRY